MSKQKKQNLEAIYPLSPMQHGTLFHTLYCAERGMYVVQLTCNLRGDLNVLALRQAWEQVTDRHSVLRTAFVWERRDQPLQVALQQVDLPWEQEDWRRATGRVSAGKDDRVVGE